MRFWKIALPVCTVLSVLFIFYNSLTPSGDISQRKEQVVGVIEHVVKWVTGRQVKLGADFRVSLSKCGHVAEFSLFSFLLSCSVLLIYGSVKDRFYSILFCGVFVALADEHLQGIMAGRSSRVTDVIIDLAAVWLSYGVVSLISNRMERRKEKNESSVLYP